MGESVPETDSMDVKDMASIDRYILGRLTETVVEVRS